MMEDIMDAVHLQPTIIHSLPSLHIRFKFCFGAYVFVPMHAAAEIVPWVDV